MAMLLCSAAIADGGWTTLYADEPWYRQASGETAVVSGRLQRHAPPGGPGGRAALAFALETDGRTLPVYAPGRPAVLESLLGRRVAIEGRRVDLSDEGFGVELWPGRIRAGDAD